ncbi:uncharacterized protein LOC127722211 [Mytilus californianus]|uniref:uncharacterized protein LOC127722211 n=1 Tax=Mytilus californianus TaxID=6549 RepID=UPI002245996F|nr:uncharacterized protein LOC127722211 [Mytilus californianus]
MRNIVKLVFLVYILTVYYCEAVCHFKKVQAGKGLGCLTGNQHIARGAAKRVDCELCRCIMPAVVQCCPMGMKITSHPDDCKVVKRGCKEVVVKISDESIPCTEGVAGVPGY